MKAFAVFMPLLLKQEDRRGLFRDTFFERQCVSVTCPAADWEIFWADIRFRRRLSSAWQQILLKKPTYL